MKKIGIILLILSMLCMMLTGCNKDKEQTEEEATQTKDSASTELSYEDEISASVLEVSEDELNNVLNEISTSEELSSIAARSQTLADGVLCVGTNTDFPPFSYLSSDGQISGMDIAMMKAVAKVLGCEVTFSDMSFSSLISSVGSEVDIAAAGITITDDRLLLVDFTDPYFESIQYIVSDKSIKSRDDLNEIKLGAKADSTGEFLAQTLNVSEVKVYPSANEAIEAINSKEVDAVIIDEEYALSIAGSKGLNTISGQQLGFDTESYAIALPKGDESIREAINSAIILLKDNGTVDKLKALYIGE